MRKLLLVILCLPVAYCLMAQETVRQKEIGLVFSNLDNFGITFKTGTNNNLWRFNTLIVSGSNMKEEYSKFDIKQDNLGCGLKIGKEYRKNLVNNIELRYGIDASFYYNRSKTDIDNKNTFVDDKVTERITYSRGVNLVLGLNYMINDNFVLGVELLPGINYTTGETSEKMNNVELNADISGIDYSLSNNSVLFTLAYKIK